MAFNSFNPFQQGGYNWQFGATHQHGDDTAASPSDPSGAFQSLQPASFLENPSSQPYHETTRFPNQRAMTLTGPIVLPDINNVIKPGSAEPWAGVSYGRNSSISQMSSTEMTHYASDTFAALDNGNQPTTPMTEPTYTAVSDSGYRSGHTAGPTADASHHIPHFTSPSANRGSTREACSVYSHESVREGRVRKAPSVSRRKAATESGMVVCEVQEDGKVCGKRLKNNSEAKKHKSAHEKPHACHYPQCQGKKNFGTPNDLDRHLVNVHSEMSKFKNKQGGYVCYGCQQADGDAFKEKFWRRKDNFKAHLGRKHKGQNEAHLLTMSKRDERPDDEPSISGRASTSRVNAAEADLSEIISNVDMSTVDDPMSAFSQNIPSDFQSAFSLESGNREVLAGIGQAPSVHPLDEYALSSNFRDDTGPGFQGMLENDLSKLEHASGLGNGETYSTQYVSSGRDDVSAPIDLLNDSRFGTGKPSGIEQQPDVPYEQNSLHTVMRGQLSPNEDSVPDADQDAGNKMMCEYCGKTKQRECDLRKHLKRHTRPYGCTHPECGKRMGSRNDWKRHEVNQHFLTEAWRCKEGRQGGGECCKFFESLAEFTQHLADDHGHTHLFSASTEDAKNDPTVIRMHIGRQGHSNFWCGFCGRLINQAASGDDEGLQLHAWDARFKHIGDHFDNGDNIRDWICVKSNKPFSHLSDEYLDVFQSYSRQSGHRGTRKLPTGPIAPQKQLSEEDSDLGDDGIPNTLDDIA